MNVFAFLNEGGEVDDKIMELIKKITSIEMFLLRNQL